MTWDIIYLTFPFRFSKELLRALTLHNLFLKYALPTICPSVGLKYHWADKSQFHRLAITIHKRLLCAKCYTKYYRLYKKSEAQRFMAGKNNRECWLFPKQISNSMHLRRLILYWKGKTCLKILELEIRCMVENIRLMQPRQKRNGSYRSPGPTEAIDIYITKQFTGAKKGCHGNRALHGTLIETSMDY